MTRDELNRILDNPAFRARNAHLLGGVDTAKHNEPPRALVGCPPAKPSRKSRVAAGRGVTVTLVAFVPRRIDPDNLGAAMKPLQDAIAGTLGVDDGDERVRWEYGQVETRGTGGVVVKVEAI